MLEAMFPTNLLTSAKHPASQLPICDFMYSLVHLFLTATVQRMLSNFGKIIKIS